MKRRNTVAAIAAFAALAGAGPGAWAQDAAGYPNRPVKIIVGYGPGGPTDLVARLAAEKLSASLGQPVIVENKPGGGSHIGSEAVAKAAPDGYTLLMGTIANTIGMSVYRNLRYDVQRDLIAVSQMMSAPSVLVASPSLGVNSVKDLVALAKAKPGKLTYASSGTGGSPHLAGEWLEQVARVAMVHIPYRGGAAAARDVMAGHVDFGFQTALSALPHMKVGKLKPLAVAAHERLALMPDVPTMAEAGYPGFEVSSWNGLFAPAGTPPAIIGKLHREMVKIVAMPDVRAKLLAQAATPIGSSPEQFRAFVKAEIERWAKVVKAADIRID